MRMTGAALPLGGCDGGGLSRHAVTIEKERGRSDEMEGGEGGQGEGQLALGNRRRRLSLGMTRLSQRREIDFLRGLVRTERSLFLVGATLTQLERVRCAVSRARRSCRLALEATGAASRKRSTRLWA